MLYKYIINDIPKSLNRYAGRNNKWEYREDKKTWTSLVTYSCMQNRPNKPIEKGVVSITYYFKTRARRDPDNYSGKMIMDGLVNAGVIKDDSFKCIDLVLKGRHDKENPRTEIEIEEV